MRKKIHLLALSDIIECMNRIEDYTEGVDYDSFSCNQMLIDAVIRNLEVIGEASRNVPENIRNGHPEIPWKKMIGLRNILIHEYFGVDESIVWEIATKNMKETKPYILKVIQDVEDIT